MPFSDKVIEIGRGQLDDRQLYQVVIQLISGGYSTY